MLKTPNNHNMTFKIFLLIAFTAMISCDFSKATEEKVSSNITQDTVPTVKIGPQEWMISNLDVVTFNNGDTILEAKKYENWIEASNEKKAAWCYYGNDPKLGEKYGKMYNFYAVNDPRGIAPNGYHLPSKTELDRLISYLGGDKIAGKKLKSTDSWYDNGNGTNESGFSGLAGGYTFDYGEHGDLGGNGNWWSSSEDSLGVFVYSLVNNSDEIHFSQGNKGDGYSVRCIKNSTSSD